MGGVGIGTIFTVSNLEKLTWGRRVIIGGRVASKDMRGLIEAFFPSKVFCTMVLPLVIGIKNSLFLGRKSLFPIFMKLYH